MASPGPRYLGELHVAKKVSSRTPTDNLAPEAQSTARPRAVNVQRAGLTAVSAVVGELGSQKATKWPGYFWQTLSGACYRTGSSNGSGMREEWRAETWCWTPVPVG